LQDHLFNNRVTFRPVTDSTLNLGMVQNYYPFGENMGDTTMNYSISPTNNYKYSDNEWQPELNLNTYDFDARHYDPILGRFLGIDPLAEESEDWSPYNYVENSPMNLVDPDGMQPSNGNWTGVPFGSGGGSSGGLFSQFGGYGGSAISGVSGFVGGLSAFNINKPVSKTNWSGLGKVQGNRTQIDAGDVGMALGGLAQDLQQGLNGLKALMRQTPFETGSSLIKGLRNGSIKHAMIHSFVKTTVKFATGSKFDRDNVLGTVTGEVLQLGFPEGEITEFGELSKGYEPFLAVDKDGNILKTVKSKAGNTKIDAEARGTIHTQLRQDESGNYAQRITFDSKGRKRSDTHFTTHNEPNKTNPHKHTYYKNGKRSTGI